jgi:FAD/FMN-containing dehydrogenase
MSLIDDLRRHVRGRVLFTGDEEFDHVRRPWNLAVEQPVLALVEAADAADVAALVAFAGSAGLAVATQAGGHGASGDVEGVILLRTGRLADLDVRVADRTARVGAGVAWGAVLSAAGPHGLIGLAGSSPVVSVVGYTLGGGLSWFSRRHGFAANSVRALDVVGADGSAARVTGDTDADLFWALRGGGGDFAVVTALEFDLHPAPHLYGGRMLWPADRARHVFDAFRAITADAPDELTLWVDLLQFPETPPFVAADATFLGPVADARTLLAPLERIDGLISDGRGPLPVADLGDITAEPTDPGPGVSRAELLRSLDDTIIDALLAAPIEPLLSVHVRHLGGALARPFDSAASHVDEPYALYTFGVPDSPAPAPAIRSRQTDLVSKLGAHVTGRKPQTLLAPGDDVTRAFPSPTLDRLRHIKGQRDPRNVLRSNHPVVPTTEAAER